MRSWANKPLNVSCVSLSRMVFHSLRVHKTLRLVPPRAAKKPRAYVTASDFLPYHLVEQSLMCTRRPSDPDSANWRTPANPPALGLFLPANSFQLAFCHRRSNVQFRLKSPLSCRAIFGRRHTHPKLACHHRRSVGIRTTWNIFGATRPRNCKQLFHQQL